MSFSSFHCASSLYMSDFCSHLASSLLHCQATTARHRLAVQRLAGCQVRPYGFVFERPISVKDGANHIALLSATVGLKNYGSYYEKMPAGIVGGPVQLISGNATRDLSKNRWSYMIGLDGEERQLHLESASKGLRWSNKIPDGERPFTWYKATFQAPLGSDPVVVDLQGMGKGAAWVNGKSIGRFWIWNTSKDDKCAPCDYSKIEISSNH